MKPRTHEHQTSPEIPDRWKLGSSFVSKDRYTDAAFLELEYERLLPRVWQMACREEDLRESGSFYEYQIGRDSVLVAPRAFSNGRYALRVAQANQTACQLEGRHRCLHRGLPHRWNPPGEYLARAWRPATVEE